MTDDPHDSATFEQPFEVSANAIRATLRQVYGFVPLDLGEHLAKYVHDRVTAYRDEVLVSLARQALEQMESRPSFLQEREGKWTPKEPS